MGNQPWPQFENVIRERSIGALRVVSFNDKLLAKFHSGTLSIIDTMRLMSLFSIIDRTSIGILKGLKRIISVLISEDCSEPSTLCFRAFLCLY